VSRGQSPKANRCRCQWVLPKCQRRVTSMVTSNDYSPQGSVSSSRMYAQQKGRKSADVVFCVVGEVTSVVEPVLKG
jgi:hypothetical protein